MRVMAAIWLMILALVGSAWGVEHQRHADRVLDRTAVVYVESLPGLKVQVGSGWAMKDDGLKLVTAQHVAFVAPEAQVWFCATQRPDSCVDVSPLDGVGPVVSSKLHHDWVVWSVEALPAGLKASRIDKPKLGETVWVSGSPMGRIGEITKGTIANYWANMLVVDARTLPGNSGGPVFNDRAAVVGMVIAIEVADEGDGSESMLPTTGLVLPAWKI